MAFPHDGKKMKKGETLNPNGRPRKWVSTLKAQGYKQSEVADCIQVLISMGKEELQRVDKDESATILERTVAAALLKGQSGKSLWNIELLLNRVHGKPKEVLDATISGEIVVTMNINNENKIM